MGADNSKAEKFWEVYGDAILVVLWHTWKGETEGYYCGYVGWKDSRDKFPVNVFFHCGDAVGGMNTREIPEIGVSVNVVGFDTDHGYDYNIGPRGEKGCWHRKPWQTNAIEWTKEKVFQRLREVVDKVIADRLEMWDSLPFKEGL